MKRRASRFVAIWAVIAFGLASAALPSTTGPAVAATSAAGSAVSVSRTITRAHLVNGAEVVADSRNVTMRVDQTQSLRSRQSVGVTWQGAHPTGNPQGDINSPLGVNDEFPYVLLQCRGVDSTTVPEPERLSPQTCWTQTGPQERFTQTPSSPFPAWRVDRYAGSAERTFHVDDPRPLPKGCDDNAFYATRRVPFVSVTGTTFFPDGGSCTDQPPESLVVDNASQPGNTTYGITRPDGKGDTKFTVWSTQDNASLGCSQTVKCALVAVPVLGVSCDVSAVSLPSADRAPANTADSVAKDCMSTGNYGPGEEFKGSPPALSVSGRLWWTASNWRNRMTVPLTFAAADNVCDVVGGKEPIDLYGSELMTQAMIQWRPAFCLDGRRTPFRHVQVGEPQAANLVAQSSIEAGLVTHPPDGGYNRPVVNAPVAFSGFAVGYSVDDAQRASYTKLRLTPRLIAKLLTMSYPGQLVVQQEYQALHNNPLDLSLDPEFQALNPGIKKGVFNSVSAATMLSLSSDSDVIRSLTAYLNSDKEARTWLDGAADPWGMTVNPNYRKIALPVQTWPQRDTFEPKKYYASGLNPCLQNSPVPYLPLIASPTIRMSNISFAMQFANSTSQVNCVEAAPGSTEGLKLVAGGRQIPGARFVLGLTSLGDAARYDLDTVALQTGVAGDTKAKFTSDSGRTFVAPTSDGLRAAARLLTPDVKAGVWVLPVARIVNEAAAKTAYPGAMVVNAAVPTLGVPAGDAQAYAALLRWVATTGQVPGSTSGTLPKGYLPLTAANGLGQLSSFTAQAASAVAAQKGVVPPVVASPLTGGTTGRTRGTTSATTKPAASVAGALLRSGGPLAVGGPFAVGGLLGSGGPLGSGGSGGLLASGGSGGSGGPSAAGGLVASGGSSGSGGSTTKPGGSVTKANAAGPTLASKPLPGRGPGTSVARSLERIATAALDIGVTGALARILLLVALVLGGAVPLTLSVRQLRGRRG